MAMNSFSISSHSDLLACPWTCAQGHRPTPFEGSGRQDSIHRDAGAGHRLGKTARPQLRRRVMQPPPPPPPPHEWSSRWEYSAPLSSI